MLPKDDTRLGFSIPEVAKMIGLNRDTAYDRARDGEIPTRKIGGRLIVPRWWLESFATPDRPQAAGN